MYLIKLTIIIFISVTTLFNTAMATESTPTAEQLEAWFNDDSELRAEAINEGQLNFLAVNSQTLLHSENVLTISQKSIDDGWVRLQQCYKNLDSIAQAQVVYSYRFIQNLKIVSTERIGHAWVDGPSIQLEDVMQHASLCTEAEIRVFYQNSDNSFSLVNGPFQRRFLDGYYPLRVSLDIQYPKQTLSFISITPTQTEGFTVMDTDDGLFIDAVFEGKLNTEIKFSERVTTKK